MGRLAVRLCIGGGALALVVQLVSIFLPVFEQSALSPIGLLMGYPMVKCTISQTTMELRVNRFIGLQDMYRAARDNPDRQHRLEKERKQEEEDKIMQLPANKRDEARKKMQEDKDNLHKLREHAKKQIGDAWKEYECGSWFSSKGSKDICIEIPLSKLATLFSNAGIAMFQTLLPSFPGSHNTAQWFYWGGIINRLFYSFIVLFCGLGCGYLYYYGEVKATKTARKGALISFVAAPILALLGLIVLITLTVIGSSTGSGNPFLMLVSSKSGVFLREGAVLAIFNLIWLFMLLVFSRFWRLKRAERVRKQRKDEEEEEEFMRLMGIDPNAAFEDSEEEDEDDDESEDEDEEATTATQRSSAFTPSTGVSRPQIVASQPVYGYNSVQPQVIQVGGGQPNVQRVYL